MRLLYPRPDLFRSRLDCRGQGEDGGRDPRAHERQYLPLRGLSQHRRSHPAGHGATVMIGFEYARSSNVADVVRQMAASPKAKFIAGGTNLVDLMKMHVERPTKLIDISKLPLDKVEETGGGLRIGALVRNTDLAYHPLVEKRYPMLSSAIMAGASQQLRNMASVGGNLLQRTRCAYFY